MRLIMLALIVIISVPSVFSQEGAEDLTLIKKCVANLFEGMKTGDSAKVHQVFRDDVIFQTTSFKDGKPILSTGSLNRFLNAIGTPHDEIWDERIDNLEIHIDGLLATAWMDYGFYVGDRFSHCGVNAMTLFKSDSGWKIIYLIDTRRKDNCKL